MESSSKSVYVVIVTWNGVTWIRQAIESLQRSTFPVRIVIVDNASTDETVKIVRDFCSEAEIFCMSDNLGFAQANNHGIRYVLSQGADYVLLLNQDVKVAPETVGELVVLLEKKRDYGVVSPLHSDYEGHKINQEFIPYIQENTSLVSDALLGRMDELYEVTFVSAAVWLVRRCVFEIVGGFDPLFFMYGEDNDYCQRVQYHGFKIGVATKVIANHWHGGSISKSLTLQQLANRRYVQVLHLLKRPERHFLHNIIGLFIGWLRMALHQLIELDIKTSFAVILSLLRGVFALYKVWKHYKLSKEPVAPWL